MASRRRVAHPDLPSVKKSRASFTGAVTKAMDKLSSVPRDSPEQVRGINTKDVDRILLSLERTEKGFLQTLEEAQDFCPEDEEEEQVFQHEEDAAGEAFSSSLSMVRDLGEQLLGLKSVLNGLANFRTDLSALQESLEEKPESNQVEDLQSLKSLYSRLRQEWDAANLDPAHPIRGELDSCRKVLTCLGADVATAKDKSDSHSSSSSTTSSSAPSPCYIMGRNDLPTIDVPKFTGDILDWSSFWSAFKSTIEDRKELSDTQRLHYLRQAIKDPELQLLLHSPAESPDFYAEVVTELKERFAKTREIHKLLSRTLADLTSPKLTRTDLRKLVDLVKRTISSIKATKQYDMDSFLSSIVFSVLPSRLQTSWAQATKKEKGVPPIGQLLTYLRDHAETLPATSTTPAATTPDTSSKKSPPNKKFDRKQDYHKSKGVNSVTPTTSYRWECWICKPEKHPLHTCPKWASYTVPQRLGHVRSKNICANCLAGGHTLSQCKSTYRCRDCGQNHHTSIHQDSATTTPVNSAAAKAHQVPDALMTTAQVLLIGPRGQEVKARALIDSGAGLSIISHKVVGLPLHPSNLQLTGVQGSMTRPVKFFTSLTISPLLNREKKIHCKPAVVQVVTADIPAWKIQPVNELPHLLGLHLADAEYNIPNRIDILLGADMAPRIMSKMVPRTGQDNEPMAQAT